MAVGLASAVGLRDFLAAVQTLPGVLWGGNLPVNLPSYFWTAAAAL